jgi:hypothetical protein
MYPHSAEQQKKYMPVDVMEQEYEVGGGKILKVYTLRMFLCWISILLSLLPDYHVALVV